MNPVSRLFRFPLVTSLFVGPLVSLDLIGLRSTLKYTTIGDTVNIASRLESFSKNLTGFDFTNRACRVLIGESTLRYLGNQFRTEKVGELSLKGKAEKITAHCLVGRVDEHSNVIEQEERV